MIETMQKEAAEFFEIPDIFMYGTLKSLLDL